MSARTKLTAIFMLAILAIVGIQGVAYLEERDRAIRNVRTQAESVAAAASVAIAAGSDVAAAQRGEPEARTKVLNTLFRAHSVSSAILQTALVVRRVPPQSAQAGWPGGRIGSVVAYAGEPTPLLPSDGFDLDTLPIPGPLQSSSSKEVGGYVVGVATVESLPAESAYVVTVASLEGTAVAGRGLAILLTSATVAFLLFLVAISRGFTRRLEKLAEAARHLGEGDLGYRVEIEGRDEIAALGEAFNKMAGAIQTNRTALAEAVSELAQASAELEKQADENRRLLDQTIGAVDEERRRLATELHDSTIQALQSAAMQAEYLEMLISRGKTDQAADLLNELTRRLRDATDELRRVLFDLRPPALDRGGLLPSLENRLREAEEAAGFTTSLEVEEGLDIPDEQEAVVFRFCQEAIANAVKHSSASTLDIRLWKSGGTLRAVVKDDGQGFSVEEGGPPGHFGLIGMRDRAKLAGGKVEVHSAPGQGTRVELVLPLPEHSS